MIKVSVEKTAAGEEVVIRLPRAAAGTKSTSGKSLTIATSNGNQPVDVPGVGIVSVGVNVYQKVPKSA